MANEELIAMAKDGVRALVSQRQVDRMIEDGWELGEPSGERLRMRRGADERVVSAEEAEELRASGWKDVDVPSLVRMRSERVVTRLQAAVLRGQGWTEVEAEEPVKMRRGTEECEVSSLEVEGLRADGWVEVAPTAPSTESAEPKAGDSPESPAKKPDSVTIRKGSKERKVTHVESEKLKADGWVVVEESTKVVMSKGGEKREVTRPEVEPLKAAGWVEVEGTPA